MDNPVRTVSTHALVRRAGIAAAALFLLAACANPPAGESPAEPEISIATSTTTTTALPPVTTEAAPPPPPPAPAPVTTTKPKPAPAPPPAPKPAPAPQPAQPQRNCDPNYSGCVPVASDVDCQGGSGNGPAYVSGPVNVIGSDIYDLDRDGNGIACE